MASLLRRKRVFTPEILFTEMVVLVVLGILALRGQTDPHHIAYAVSVLAGMQGNAFHKSKGLLYGNVAVTFVVQMAFNFLIQAAFKKQGMNGEPNLFWSGLFFLVLLGFCMGGGIGFLVDTIVNGLALFMPAIIALALGLIAVDERKRGIGVDPTSGGFMG